MSVENILKPNNNDIYCRNLNVDGDTIFNGDTTLQKTYVDGNLELRGAYEGYSSGGIIFRILNGFQSFLNNYHEAFEPNNYTITTSQGIPTPPANNIPGNEIYICSIGKIVSFNIINGFQIPQNDPNILANYGSFTLTGLPSYLRPANITVFTLQASISGTGNHFLYVEVRTDGNIYFELFVGGTVDRTKTLTVFPFCLTWVIAN